MITPGFGQNTTNTTLPAGSKRVTQYERYYLIVKRLNRERLEFKRKSGLSAQEFKRLERLTILRKVHAETYSTNSASLNALIRERDEIKEKAEAKLSPDEFRRLEQVIVALHNAVKDLKSTKPPTGVFGYGGSRKAQRTGRKAQRTAKRSRKA